MSKQQHQSSAPKSSSFNSNLELLKSEMFNLRQLDLSLLQQLWSLNESINEYRILMHEQEENSPPLQSISNSEENSDEDKANAEKIDLKSQKNPRGEERDLIDAMHQKLEMMFLNPNNAS